MGSVATQSCTRVLEKEVWFKTGLFTGKCNSRKKPVLLQDVRKRDARYTDLLVLPSLKIPADEGQLLKPARVK